MKNKEIVTKQDISWHVIGVILNELTNFGVYLNDGKFNELVNSLIDYTAEKLALPCDDEVVETCVLVVQRPANT